MAKSTKKNAVSQAAKTDTVVEQTVLEAIASDVVTIANRLKNANAPAGLMKIADRLVNEILRTDDIKAKNAANAAKKAERSEKKRTRLEAQLAKVQAELDKIAK